MRPFQSPIAVLISTRMDAAFALCARLFAQLLEAILLIADFSPDKIISITVDGKRKAKKN